MTTRGLPMSNRNGRSAVGIDVGGTKIAAGIVLWPSGEVLFQSAMRTHPERGGEAILDDVIDISRRLIAKGKTEGISVEAIGIGVAELVDATGNITSSQTIPWEGVPVKERLSVLRPADIESDVRAAALAEATLGAGVGFSSFVYVTVGTGISCCLVEHGRPYAGARGNALVMGSSPLSTTCTSCGQQLHPILEEISSGPAIAAQYQNICAQSSGVLAKASSCEDVFKAAAMGESGAKELLRHAGHALGVSVAFLANVLDPEAIVVGGGVGLAGGIYWESFLNSTREHVWSAATRELSIRTAALGTKAGVIGAAAKTFPRQSNSKEQDLSA
jgi:glucokinase